MLIKKSTAKEINSKFWTEILKYRPDIDSLKSLHLLPKQEKQSDKIRCYELITAYCQLINEQKRKEYNELLSIGNADSLVVQNIELDSFLETFWAMVMPSSTESGGLLSSEKHSLQFNKRFEAIELFNKGLRYSQQFILKDSFNPFLNYLDASTTRLDKLKEKPSYTPVAKKMSTLSIEIKDSIENLDTAAKTEAVLEVLNTCKNILAQAQLDADFNEHRGFLKRTPILNHLCFVFGVLIRMLNFVFLLVANPKAIQKNEPYYGLFRQEKTKIASEIDALAHDIQTYIDACADEKETSNDFPTKNIPR